MFGIVLTVTACSEQESNKVNVEKQIRDLLDEENIAYDVIIDYDLKDDYFFVYYRPTFGSLAVSIIKQNQNDLEFILSNVLSGRTTVIGDGETPFVSVVQPEEPSIKSVEVQGKPARLVTYIDQPMEGVTLDVRYWVAYSYTNPIEEITIIEE